MADMSHNVPPAGMRTKGLGRDTVWNLFGMSFPVVVAVFTIPFIIHRLGNEQFGVLSLIWMLVGYFSIFDMGLGRALTRLVAERISHEKTEELPGLFWTAIGMMYCLGLVGAGLMVALSAPLAMKWLNISDAFREQALMGFRVTAISLPIVVMNTGLTGVLEACRRFRLVNILRIPAGTFTFLGPALVLPFTTNMAVIVAVLVLGRIAECVGYFLGCLAALPPLRAAIRFERREVMPLLSFGGWMTVSNLAVPFMQHIDRFIIGMLRPVALVTFFATPAEIVVRLLIFTRARISVLFPEFVAGHARADSGLSALFVCGMKYLLLAIYPIMLGVVVFTPVGLRVWLGPEFELRSSLVMVLMTGGVLVYSMAMVPWFLLQGVGRPDLAAKAHLVQLPLYLAGTAFLCWKWGIVGSAAAWAARSAVDWLWMLWLARRFLDRGALSLHGAVFPVLLAAGTLAVAAWPAALLFRILAATGGFVVFYAYAWTMVMTADERQATLSKLRTIGR